MNLIVYTYGAKHDLASFATAGTLPDLPVGHAHLLVPRRWSDGVEPVHRLNARLKALTSE